MHFINSNSTRRKRVPLSLHTCRRQVVEAISWIRFQDAGLPVTRNCVLLNGSQYVENKLIGNATNIDKPVTRKHLFRISPHLLSSPPTPLFHSLCFLSRRSRITCTLIRLHLRSTLIYLCLIVVLHLVILLRLSYPKALNNAGFFLLPFTIFNFQWPPLIFLLVCLWYHISGSARVHLSSVAFSSRITFWPFTLTPLFASRLFIIGWFRASFFSSGCDISGERISRGLCVSLGISRRKRILFFSRISRGENTIGARDYIVTSLFRRRQRHVG